MAREEYLKKLRDPRWQKRRLEILSRDNFTCQACFDSTSTLHVHHRWYDKCEPWEYDDAALVTLCEICHEEETVQMAQACQLLLESVKRQLFSAEVLELATAIRYAEMANPKWATIAAFSWALQSPDEQALMIQKWTARPRRDFKSPHEEGAET